MTEMRTKRKNSPPDWILTLIGSALGIGLIAGMLGFVVGVYVLFGWGFQYLWNALLASSTPLPEITLWQAALALFLIHVIMKRRKIVSVNGDR